MTISERYFRQHLKMRGLIGTTIQILRDPTKIKEFTTTSPHHFYNRELTPRRCDIITFCRPLTSTPESNILQIHKELLKETDLQRRLERKFQSTKQRPNKLHRNWREILYVLVRLSRPSVVVETGTFDGLSAAYILEGLQQNDHGKLISIDINESRSVPDDVSESTPGWVIPEELRVRWDLQLGDSKEILPSITETDEIDLFLHDSLHTYEHMEFEFKQVSQAMEPGDILLSDNARFNSAFRDFSKENLSKIVCLKNTDYAVRPDGTEIDDRLAGGIISNNK